VFVWGNFGELSCEWGDLLPKDVRGDEVFGLRATAGRGVWEEGKRQGARGLGGGQTLGAKYYLSRYPNYLRAPKLTIERLIIGFKRVPSELLTKGA
jgi:hypothetical protein